MAVIRIVPNLFAADPKVAKAFYQRLLGLELVMDHDWILTFAGGTTIVPQLSVAREGGSGTDVPALSIEVTDVEAVYGLAMQDGFEIVYPLTDEAWGVRRFYVRDPFGNIVNILMHKTADKAHDTGGV